MTGSVKRLACCVYSDTAPSSLVLVWMFGIHLCHFINKSDYIGSLYPSLTVLIGVLILKYTFSRRSPTKHATPFFLTSRFTSFKRSIFQLLAYMKLVEATERSSPSLPLPIPLLFLEYPTQMILLTPTNFKGSSSDSGYGWICIFWSFIIHFSPLGMFHRLTGACYLRRIESS